MQNILNYLYFSKTFSDLNEKDKEISAMQRYRLVFEYSSNLKIPPPISVIFYPYYAYLEWHRRRIQRKTGSTPEAFGKKRVDYYFFEWNMHIDILAELLYHAQQTKNIKPNFYKIGRVA